MAMCVAVAALVVAPSAAADPTPPRRELSKIQQQLAGVRAQLASARTDAAGAAAALHAAEQALAGAEDELDTAERRWTAARRESILAGRSLGEATTQVWRWEGIRVSQARQTYMTGGILVDMNALLEARTLADFSARAVALDRAAKASNDTLGQLRTAEVVAADAEQRMRASEHRALTIRTEVEGKVRQLDEARTVRAEASRAVAVQVTRLRASEASLAGRSVSLLVQIRADEAAARRRAAERAKEAADRARAAGDIGAARAGKVRVKGNGTCDLSGTSTDERWIIMRESGGRPTADNPTSTAFGLGQLILANRLHYLGADYATTDCGKQLAAFRAYVADAYGNAATARAFWEANGWY
jgi:peptidoglycan hydrolase CwlO-like protein